LSNSVDEERFYSEVKIKICPQCGAPAKSGSRKCEYCGAEFLVSSLAYLDKFDKSGISKYVNHYKELLKVNSENGKVLFALGICYLNLRLYDMATTYLAKSIEQLPDFSESYYYYALSLFKHRKPKVLTLTEIKKIEDYINAAIQIDCTKSKYYYLLALVKHDFYLKNGLKINPPTFEELIDLAESCSYEREEIEDILQHVPITDQELIRCITK